MDKLPTLHDKMFNAMGYHPKTHFSDVRIKAHQPLLIFTRPGMRGHFSADTIPDRSPAAKYDVHLDGQYLGRMPYSAIVEKFNIGRI